MKTIPQVQLLELNSNDLPSKYPELNKRVPFFPCFYLLSYRSWHNSKLPLSGLIYGVDISENGDFIEVEDFRNDAESIYTWVSDHIDDEIFRTTYKYNPIITDPYREQWITNK